jgi:ATP-dependent DNA helicase PIF1
MSKNIFNAIDRLLQKLIKNNRPFGGKIMVVSGDFRKTMPIIEGISSEVVIVGNSLLSS